MSRSISSDAVQELMLLLGTLSLWVDFGLSTDSVSHIMTIVVTGEVKSLAGK